MTTAANVGVGPSQAGLAAAILNASQQIRGSLAFAPAAAFLALATKNTHEYPVHHAAEAEAGQPQLAAGPEPTREITR